MTAETFVLSSSDSAELRLRLAEFKDQENLRKWKNDQRQFFFHKQIISPEQQIAWFRDYRTRPDDYMFMVVPEREAIGCIGLRLLDSGWDIYNVLCEPAARGKGYMSQSLRLTLAFAYQRVASVVELKVLKINPAVQWYEKNGFSIATDGGDHYVMRHDRAPGLRTSALVL